MDSCNGEWCPGSGNAGQGNHGTRKWGKAMRQRWLWVALAIATLATSEVFAQVFAQGAIDAEIAPMGKLRYGLNASNAALSARAADGSVSGISIDLGKFIAGRLGAAFEPVVYASTGDFTRSFEKGSWDITVVGTSPGAKEQFAFTPDILLVDYVYLAGPGRAFTSIADVDRPGVKVGASENGSGSQFLERTLKSAELMLGPGSVASEVELLGTGKVDAYGSNTNNLLLISERLPGAAYAARSSPFISRWRCRKQDRQRRSKGLRWAIDNAPAGMQPKR
jgi:polar amino acid transport system substrate-binding protein